MRHVSSAFNMVLVRISEGKSRMMKESAAGQVGTVEESVIEADESTVEEVEDDAACTDCGLVGFAYVVIHGAAAQDPGTPPHLHASVRLSDACTNK